MNRSSEILSGRNMLTKVPEVTLYFWVIKILCTTVGETAADFLNANLNLGLTGTSLVMGILLALALFFQFRSKKYVPEIYWLAVVLISVVGTLITDNLTDNLGIKLEVTTLIFALALTMTFTVWYLSEKTLSIHTINTVRREIYYWLAILCTFALGTAAGDLLAERFDLGYLLSAVIFAGGIAAVYAAYNYKLNAIFSFWIAYILTRPLGASLGDYLSQSQQVGGLGLGTVATTIVFLTTIVATVVYIAATKLDMIADKPLRQNLSDL